ncbi:MAG: CDP-alcohol phosphatidyltransferase family protein [Actinomycetales bacterium]
MTSVRTRLALGLAGAVSVLAVLGGVVGLRSAGWAAGAAADLAVFGLYGWALARSGATAPRPADYVTLARAALVGGVAALVADAFAGQPHLGPLVGLAAVALALDAVDGQVARRTRTASALGARFDMEVDALLILLLSAYVARSLGGWVLLIGLARYLLLAAGSLWPWLRRPTPPRYWAKVVAATQGVTLTVVASGLLPHVVAVLVMTAALGLLAESFLNQVAVLAGLRERVAMSRILSVAAVVLVWAALALPDQLTRLSVSTFVPVPAEGLVLAAAALLLPAGPRRALSTTAGGLLGVLVLLKLLDMGYYSQLDRAFNPVIEWSSLGPAVGVLRDSVGSVWAYLAVGVAVLLAIAVVGLLAWAALRVSRVSAGHRRLSAMVVGALALVWTAGAVLGLDVAPQTAVASGTTTQFAATEVRNIAAAARDRREFPDQLRAADSYAERPAGDLLAGLKGKDVIVAFVESYGQRAVQDSAYAPGVVSVLDAGTRQLTAAGFSARSAFLTSPTFGGLSWLAHSTLQSGLWIDNQQRYGQLVDSSRFTLSDAFKKAGWRTVSVAPADDGPWPEGTSFYHFDQLYNATNVGYEGPRFSYATMPDQFSLKAFRDRELTPGHAPVMAELDLVSSHYPWTPLPRILPWDSIGDGSIYDPMPAQGPSVPSLYTNYDNVRTAYGRSIQYSVQSLVSFVQNAHDPNLVLILLGDHQPAPKVSGVGATHEVPISIVAHDPTVFDKIAGWSWEPGLHPSRQAPVWPMDTFRNRLLDAYQGTGPSTISAARQQAPG